MMCPKCDETEMVIARATTFGDEYYYCRTCKQELDEIIMEEINEENDRINKEQEKLLAMSSCL